ncbi:ester cyclase [Nocardia sp. bgisy118]|uniref:ester cyclase n=1 Tax=Nocardia sp. bgisy118 TaxID=3413786 RepID=UPI003F49D1E6
MMASPPDELLATFYRAFSGEVDLLDTVLTPDWEDIPLAPGQAPGRDGIKPLIAAFSQAFAEVKVVIHAIVDGRDDNGDGLVGVRGEICGTHRGEWFGVPGSGREVHIPIHEFHEIAAGRIVRTWHLEDWFGWFQQVGAWSAEKEKEEA